MLGRKKERGEGEAPFSPVSLSLSFREQNIRASEENVCTAGYNISRSNLMAIALLGVRALLPAGTTIPFSSLLDRETFTVKFLLQNKHTTLAENDETLISA